MKEKFTEFLHSWLLAIKKKSFVIEFIISIVILVAVINVFSIAVGHVENRGGAVLDDPILVAINSIDLTWQTFFVIYICFAIAFVHLISRPEYLAKCIQAYSLLLSFRLITMFITPIRYPDEMIPLVDPFVQLVFNSDEVWKNDLFFSGHTSAMFLFFLIVKGKVMKTIMLVSTILIGIFVILQHVHYTVDVVAAPFFAWGAWSIVRKLSPEFFLEEKK
jgi:PAP2 superfamily C-terminal